MYNLGNVSDRGSVSQYRITQNRAKTDFSALVGLNTDQAQTETELISAAGSEEAKTGNVRQLTAIDLTIQKELESEFGIKAWRPGDDLKDQLLPSSFCWGAGKNNTGSIDENADKAFAIFQKHLAGFMQNEEIRSEPAIELNVGADGRVILKNDHPDREKIENFINQNSELRNLYVGVTNAKNLVAIGKEAAKFQERYAVDPKSAVTEFAHLFSGNYQYNSSLKISKDDWQLTTQSFFRLS